MQRPTLPFLEDVKHSAVDEAIWGHRLRQDQTGWLLVLEMLNVAQACLTSSTKDPLADMGRTDAPDAVPLLRVRFRNLLFLLNQKAAELAASIQHKLISSDEAWQQWLAYAKEEYDGPDTANYTPLRERFDDFVQFERAIDLTRSTAISGLDDSKGIYNRFIFPMAAEALYWETGIKTVAGERQLDSTFNTFTRAGTLLHIMLARSKSAPELRTLLTKFLTRESQARRLVQLLQIDEKDPRKAPKTYLPYDSHPRFDLLGEDYVNILSLKCPDNDKLNWLVPLSALHLSLYHAEIAHEQILSRKLPLPMICEIVAQKKTVVRQLSLDSLDENSDLARKAVDTFLKAAFASAEWLKITSADLPADEKMERAGDYIKKNLRPPDKEVDDPKATGQIDVLQNEVMRYFRERHGREFSRVHFKYGQEAGLVSKRKTNRYRYAPTDQLLQSLVLANVAEESPFEDFLDHIFSRYGIVVGPRQQTALKNAGYDEISEAVSGQAFRHNQVRLESRLKSMGMLRRLSDSQAYVLNPLQPRV
jgi:hypothetical protein